MSFGRGRAFSNARQSAGSAASSWDAWDDSHQETKPASRGFGRGSSGFNARSSNGFPASTHKVSGSGIFIAFSKPSKQGLDEMFICYNTGF